MCSELYLNEIIAVYLVLYIEIALGISIRDCNSLTELPNIPDRLNIKASNEIINYVNFPNTL